ncbi:FKBP-type peptidyl-prolyl cis-trans isomerase [Parafannyhessea umbonata]|uniref:Peptidyl-prolyl cis-trans isomerase n=1 Tax=Parafannyhessea umbonata TaxID=604330 RepID=A0A1H9N492_9ACTN|nr:peptidylprolyl isomerase [Parafannyhessea umbonata]SER30651.1 FKBP-type peptidyl-prolyl cis-trans isomerase 2 [Parafannyhessea umbonata]
MSNEGKKVKVHYVGTLDDGTKFDSSRDRNEPLGFTCMAGQMIAGFDKAVRDMEVGQTANVHLEPEEAYGERREDLIQEFPMSQVPEQMRGIKVGEKVMLQSPQGLPVPATVCKVTPEAISLDLNHEMAGKALNFEIELLEVED